MQTIADKYFPPYSQAYFDRLKFISVDIPRMVLWDTNVVIREVMECLKMKHSPPDLLIGTDARLVLPFLRMIPSWLLDILLIANAPATPAAMKK